MGGQQQNQNTEFNTLFPGIQNNMQTGGYDPTQLAKVEGGYGDFISTGGYTPTQANQFLQRATE